MLGFPSSGSLRRTVFAPRKRFLKGSLAHVVECPELARKEVPVQQLNISPEQRIIPIIIIGAQSRHSDDGQGRYERRIGTCSQKKENKLGEQKAN